MLEAILFDLGDTLLDFEPMDTRAVFRGAASNTYAYLQTKGCALPPLDKYFKAQVSAVKWAYFWSKLRGREFNCLHLLRSFCQRRGFPTDETTLHELAWMWYEPVVQHSSIEHDLIPTLSSLRDSGLKFALVSNTFIPGTVLDRHLRLAGLLDFFPIRFYSSEVGYRKPHPRIFEMALRAVGVAPRNAIFVGDLVKTDIIGARGVGMRTVLRRPFGTVQDHRVADVVIRRIAELPQILTQHAPAPATLRAPTAAPAYES